MSEARRKIDEINSAFYRSSALYSQWAQKRKLNLHTVLAYYTLYSSGPLSQKQISDYLGMPKQTVNRIIKAMDLDSHVTLVADAGDKRAKKIKFTENGKIYAAELLTPLFDLEEKVFQRLGDKRIQLMLEATTAYGDILQEEMEKLE